MMWWSLLGYPLMFAASIYAGYRWRARERSRLKSLVGAIMSGAALGLAASVTTHLALSYDYYMRELLTVGIPTRQIVLGAIPGALMSAAGWKARSDVERRQRGN